MRRPLSLFFITAFAINLVTSSTALGNPEIQESPYTEALFEVTDQGIYDPEGRLVSVEELESELMLPDFATESATDDPAVSIEAAFEAYKQTIIENWGGKKVFTEERLKNIRQNLQDELNRFDSLEKKVSDTETQLAPLNEKIQTLEGQIRVFNDQIQQTKDKIKTIEFRIAEKQLGVKDLMGEMRRSQVDLNLQEDVVKDYISLVYEEESKYINLFDEGSSTLKLLLADASVSESLLGQEYLKIIESTGRDVFYGLELKNRDLVEQQIEYQKEQQSLQNLYTSLSQEKQILSEGRLAKKALLEETRGEEELYQKLLEESIQQQLESAIAIQNMKDNIDFIEQKLSLLDNQIENAQSDLETKKQQALESNSLESLQDVNLDLAEGVNPSIPAQLKSFFSWPVPPVAVTAYFHDEHYPDQWGDHNAVDLRAPMYTQIKAPADGYVVETKDNGLGYSYIILAHKNNLMTVYGHVTEIIAKPGTLVKRGDVIGLTGGLPGTKGAGLRTTGPHLHFEVYYKGDVVDPLDYLPVQELPLEYIPDEYLTDIGTN